MNIIFKKLSDTVSCLYTRSFRNHLVGKFGIKSKIQIKNNTKASAVLNEMESKETILYFEGDKM